MRDLKIENDKSKLDKMMGWYGSSTMNENENRLLCYYRSNILLLLNRILYRMSEDISSMFLMIFP